MTRHYYVDPGSKKVTGGPYDEGPNRRGYVLPSGASPSQIRHDPPIGVYIATEDNTATPRYNSRDADTLTFVDNADPKLARVQEQRNFSKYDIDTLYAEKQREVRSTDSKYRYTVFDTTLSANWWVISTLNARSELNSIAAGLAARTQGIVDGRLTNWYPDGPNAPYVAIFNETNENVRRFQLNETQYISVTEDLATHDQAVGAATEASSDALDAAYNDGNGNPDNVANHDPEDPRWGYPTIPSNAEVVAQ